MKKIWKTAVPVLLTIILIATGCIYKIDSVYDYLTKVHEEKERNELERKYEERHMDKVDLSAFEPLTDAEDAWYTKYHFIAHSGGGVDGRIYTNSIQAWDLSYEKGNRVFDADLAFTTDGVLVLRHDWNDNLEQSVSMCDSVTWTDSNGMTRKTTPQEQMDYAAFRTSKIYYKYDGMTCEDMLNYMTEHEDLYIACDMKDDVIESYRYLVNKAIDMGEESCLDRIIVNVYNYDVYDSIMNIYEFKNVTARQHYWTPNNYYELIKFCLTHDIHVVNTSACFVNDEGVQLMQEYGIHVYIAIVDYVSEMKDYNELGVDGAVTNWLYEPDWEFVE